MKADIKDTSKPYEREHMPWLWYCIISSFGKKGLSGPSPNDRNFSSHANLKG
jgi:hypothetical protein